ncbi:helix-turn-helix domain-containing protein [Amycolatopsis sp.]|uniref:helix-turn-helix domain-containing protein n=1 Tax=Amycolatopsis sp. TaxID=37632 RepID=UPI002CA1B83E|nr:helix-turn-helix domain-containing protein [Amycolatopsis sp.]HVV12778.1 helix-turn-helix domain-containing protein [Amycolatopsis sp.]
MSVEAISWALTDAPIPHGRRDAASLAVVLIGLANHAGPDGRNAFPAIATLAGYTRLSTRTVQNSLRALEELGLIRESDPEIVAAYVKRADRRPNGWDLAVEQRASTADAVDIPTQRVDNSGRAVDNPNDGAQPVHPAAADGVQRGRDGVQTTTSRGAVAAPEPSLNRPGTTHARPQRGRRRGPAAAGLAETGGRPPAPERPCGQCDGRPREPVATRLVWHGEHSVPCPRCNPRSPDFPSAPLFPAS